MPLQPFEPNTVLKQLVKSNKPSDSDKDSSTTNKRSDSDKDSSCRKRLKQVNTPHDETGKDKSPPRTSHEGIFPKDELLKIRPYLPQVSIPFSLLP